MSGRDHTRWRRLRAAAGIFGTALCAGTAAALLLIILGYVVQQGATAIDLPFLTQIPRPVGIEGGGVANGIVGSLIIVGIATLGAIPIGILTGIYLALYGRGRFPDVVRFMSDVLSGIPSIAIGLFAYTVLVQPMAHFSAVSASFAFMVMMLPIIVRATETAILSVPGTIYESALALGSSNYAAIVHGVLPAARPAIVTGLLLAVARVTGETAPLLFTAFGSQFWVLNPLRPMAELSLQIFTYALSPYESWHQQAWAGALLLIVAVFALNLLARLILTRRARV
ncbi:MAG TPA: phosphate ABC transporter permease PstA [Candidatus Binataceae bacterium]|jgi:phosphate transport system permease protein|nr:phosphate ABC transporter permease PstA [Candidatus Binataceae bacterium]